MMLRDGRADDQLSGVARAVLLSGAVLITVVVFSVGSAVGTTATNAAVASCDADARAVVAAVEAYQGQNGSYPSVPSPWSAINYVTNLSPLTNRTNNGGPYLSVAPATTQYVIEYDSEGRVWVGPPGTYDRSYNFTEDYVGSNTNACNVAKT